MTQKMAGCQLFPPPCDQPPSLETCSAVILAGGQGSRVGFRQKALLMYRGAPLLSAVLQRLTPQKLPVWINANAEQSVYQSYGYAVFSDEYKGFLGPLAGMQAAWQNVASDWIVFMPCDNPALPDTLVERLMQAYIQRPAPLVVAHDGERIQPLYLLMHRCMAPILAQAIERSHLSVLRWIYENEHSVADFSAERFNCFENLNTLSSIESTSF